METTFNTFIPKSDQTLAQDHFKNYTNRYNDTTEGMFKFVCWLKGLDDDCSADVSQTALKVGVEILAVLGMIILCPLVIGGFLLSWYSNAQGNIDCMLNDLRKIENDDCEKIIKALGIEKQGIVIPNVQKMTSSKEITEESFTQYNTPIIQCKGNFIALLIRDKKSNQTRIATIKKTPNGWKIKNLKSSRASESFILSISGGGLKNYSAECEFGANISRLKAILKGKNEYDALAFDLIKLPKEEILLGGLCLTTTDGEENTSENIETKKIIDVLGGEEAVANIPALQKRPLSSDRVAIFEQLKFPIIQSDGNFISILIQDKDNRERKIITIKKVKNAWQFKNFPVGLTSYGSSGLGGNSNTTRVTWNLDDNSYKTNTFHSNRRPTQCETHLEFLQEVLGISANKYQLAAI